MQNANVLGYNIVGGSVQQEGNSTTKVQTTSEINQTTGKRSNHGTQRSIPQPLIVDETKQYMDGFIPEDDEDETECKDQIIHNPTLLDPNKKNNGKKTRGRVKIKMEFIQNKLRRYTTFSKRKTGIMKKAYELSTLTGTQVMLLVASETGHVYTFATRKLQPMITSDSGKALIQTCLNSPDPSPAPSVQQSQSVSSVSQEASPPAQIGISVARSTLGQNEGEMQYQNEESETKTSSATQIGAINYVNQAGQSFPMAAYITQPVTQNQTTIFTPSQNTSNHNSPTVQLQGTPTVVAHNQPQILSGQLQLHRIHPQNILLTGSSSVLQPNHIILNQTNSGQPVVLDSAQTVQTTRSAGTNQDVITLVNPELATSRLQMVYSPSGTVIYAPATSTTIKRTETGQSGGDIVTLQHTPVIQTSTVSQESSSNS